MKNKIRLIIVSVFLMMFSISCSASKAEEPKPVKKNSVFSTVNKGLCSVNPWCTNDKDQ